MTNEDFIWSEGEYLTFKKAEEDILSYKSPNTIGSPHPLGVGGCHRTCIPDYLEVKEHNKPFIK